MAVALGANGGELGSLKLDAKRSGYQELMRWAAGFGSHPVFAVEEIIRYLKRFVARGFFGTLRVGPAVTHGSGLISSWLSAVAQAPGGAGRRFSCQRGSARRLARSAATGLVALAQPERRPWPRSDRGIGSILADLPGTSSTGQPPADPVGELGG